MASVPVMLDAPPVTPAATATPASATTGTAVAPGFDAILMLQNLAATADLLETGSLEAEDTSELLGGDDASDDEESGEELESSLAFLSALLTATTPKGSAGDFQSGGQSAGGTPDQSTPMSKAGPSIAEVLSLDAGATNAEKPEAALALAPLRPELLDTRPASDAQNLVRAADLLTQPTRPAAAEAPTVLTHARDPRWADDFNARISLLVRAGESTASLQLTPVDLGPVEVNVTVKDSQATIHFGAAQADTRALIEASLPRLRELLASQGFNLLDASVSSGFSRSQQQTAASEPRRDSSNEAPATEIRATRQLGLLDLYA
jgi:flagellar hook-length control protein FliK